MAFSFICTSHFCKIDCSSRPRTMYCAGITNPPTRYNHNTFLNIGIAHPADRICVLCVFLLPSSLVPDDTSGGQHEQEES